MSQFGDLAGKAQELNEKHGEAIEAPSDQVIEQAGAMADQKSGGKFSDQIAQGTQRADEAVGNDAN